MRLGKSLFIVLPALVLAFVACAPASGASSANAPSGTVLFKDDFSAPTSGWDRTKYAEGVMDYDAGGYRMLVNALQVNFVATPRKSFGDVRMEVDSSKLAGPDSNRIGLICRYAGSDYYFFIMSSDGFYGVGLFQNGQAKLLGQTEMQFSDKIKTGITVNHLRADCNGADLSFYVNGSLLSHVQDATLKQGDVGLLAGTFDQPGVDVFFDNFVVIKP